MVLYNIGWAVVYVALGVATARMVEWGERERGEEDATDNEIFMIVVFWPIVAAMLACYGLIKGTLAMVRYPPRKVRKQRQREQEAATAKAEAEELERVARELNLPTVEEEDHRRRQIAEDALGSVRAAGLEPSPAALKDVAEYQSGHITADELCERIRHRNGVWRDGGVDWKG